MKSTDFTGAPQFNLKHSFYGCAIFLPFRPPPEPFLLSAVHKLHGDFFYSVPLGNLDHFGIRNFKTVRFFAFPWLLYRNIVFQP